MLAGGVLKVLTLLTCRLYHSSSSIEAYPRGPCTHVVYYEVSLLTSRFIRTLKGIRVGVLVLISREPGLARWTRTQMLYAYDHYGVRSPNKRWA